MEDEEIKEFVSKSVGQIKAGLPDGCSIEGKFDFDISLIATKEANGKIDLHLAGAGGSAQSQQVHRIRFSIVDDKAQQKGFALAKTAIRQFVQELAVLDPEYRQVEYRPKKAKK
jgi:hypothetical protein